MENNTRLKAWDGEEADYVIVHEDALLIRAALKEYKNIIKRLDPPWAAEKISDLKRVRKIFKVAEDGIYSNEQ